MSMHGGPWTIEETTTAERVRAMPILGVGAEAAEPSPRTERLVPPAVRRTATAMTILPPIVVDARRASRDEIAAFLAQLGAKHARLDLALAYLDRLAAAAFDRDATSRPAAEVVMQRALEASELRDALGRVAIAVSDPRVEALLAPGTTLGGYLEALYLWAGHVVDTLVDFAATALRGEAGDGAWEAYDARTSELACFHVEALADRVKHEVAAAGVDAPFRDAVEELVWAAWYLHRNLVRG